MICVNLNIWHDCKLSNNLRIYTKWIVHYLAFFKGVIGNNSGRSCSWFEWLHCQTQFTIHFCLLHAHAVWLFPGPTDAQRSDQHWRRVTTIFRIDQKLGRNQVEVFQTCYRYAAAWTVVIDRVSSIISVLFSRRCSDTYDCENHLFWLPVLLERWVNGSDVLIKPGCHCQYPIPLPNQRIEVRDHAGRRGSWPALASVIRRRGW